MSSLWTPGGEHEVPRDRTTPPPEQPGPATGSPGPGPGAGQVDEEELRAVQEQLARTPAEVVVVNHCFGLFELAALHLSLEPPQLDQAKVAIDALGALVEGMQGRLGEHEADVAAGLANLRMAFVQIRAANLGAGGEGADTGSGGEPPR